jgi:hypothetical protein
MAKGSIAPGLRSAVIERARKQCEYCQRPDSQEINAYPHEVDHLTARKHGGLTTAENLALNVTVTKGPISVRSISAPVKLSSSSTRAPTSGARIFDYAQME